MISPFLMRSPTPFVPSGSSGAAGLVEKRVNASSGLNVSDSVAYIGDFAREAENWLLMDSDVQRHLNHGNDPAAHTMAISDSVGITADRPRGASNTITFTGVAHAALDGYHPSSGGGGDPDLSKHSVTFDADTLIGQPVYVSGDGKVDLAKADAVSTWNCAGLAAESVSAGATGNFLTEGSVNTANWASVTGSAALTPGAVYYLSEAAAGQLKTTPPSTGAVVRVGRALTTTKMDIEVAQEVVL